MVSRFFSVVASIVVCLSLSVQAQTPAQSELKAELAVCTSVVDRTPQGTDTTFALSVDSLYCWSKITGSSDETTVTHVWLHEGEVLAQVPLPVRSSYWRTWSVKKLYGMGGNWEVKVIDATGNTLGRVSFTVTQ
jgi:hypothetical protein